MPRDDVSEDAGVVRPGVSGTCSGAPVTGGASPSATVGAVDSARSS